MNIVTAIAFLIIAIVFSLIYIDIMCYIEKQQDLNLEKEFKIKEYFFYETCSVCGKKLKHARFGKKGDVMRCIVECRGKTTWYCEECAREYLDTQELTIPSEVDNEKM